MTVDPFPNDIAGTWSAGSDAAPNINPSDLNDTVGHYAQANDNQTVEAIECAAAAFAKWRATSPLVRVEALDRKGSEFLAAIAAVLRVPGYDAALDATNDSDFGLSAGIISQDPAKIEHFSQTLRQA